MVLDLLAEVPDELLPGASDPQYRLFREARQTIRTQLSAWERGEKYNLQFHVQHEGRWHSAICILRMILEGCADDAVMAAATELAVLSSSPDLQQELSMDIAETLRALTNREWTVRRHRGCRSNPRQRSRATA